MIYAVLFYMTLKHVDWDRVETKIFQDVCLASCVTCYALAQEHLNDITFYNVESAQNVQLAYECKLHCNIHVSTRGQISLGVWWMTGRDTAKLLRAECLCNT
jgi:hypothetical protein